MDAVLAQGGCRVAYERSDLDVRALEGLAPRSGPIRGELPEATVGIVEHGLKYRVDVAHGQKTGFYLDQRANRDRVRALAGGRDVLNCFCYTGGFTLNALAGGARSALSIDSSAAALALARENAALNGLDDGRAEWLEADVFAALRTLRDQGRSFDLVVLDPPKFAPTAGHAEKAARAYKDINLLALKLLRPAECSSLSRARAGCRRSCSRRSSPARRRTRVRTWRWSNACTRTRTIRLRSPFPRANT